MVWGPNDDSPEKKKKNTNDKNSAKSQPSRKGRGGKHVERGRSERGQGKVRGVRQGEMG